MKLTDTVEESETIDDSDALTEEAVPEEADA